jgi:hypothetical protein
MGEHNPALKRWANLHCTYGARGAAGCFVDTRMKEWHLIPILFLKGRGDGWGTADSSSKCNRCDFSRPVLYEVESAFG